MVTNTILNYYLTLQAKVGCILLEELCQLVLNQKDKTHNLGGLLIFL